jgi:hypothetical protein
MAGLFSFTERHFSGSQGMPDHVSESFRVTVCAEWSRGWVVLDVRDHQCGCGDLSGGFDGVTPGGIGVFDMRLPSTCA